MAAPSPTCSSRPSTPFSRPLSGLAFAMLSGGGTHAAIAATSASADTAPMLPGDSREAAREHEDLTVLGNAYQQRSTKMTAPLLDTPKTVDVISKELIKATGSNSLAEALRTVPGITFGAGEGGNSLGDRPFLRGYDAQASTFLDGVRDVGAQTRETFNVEKVSVIKGDAGAFNGRGGAGGAIYIDSKLPSLTDAASASLGFGTSDYKRGTMDINQRVSDHAAIRLNLMGYDTDIPDRGPAHYRRYGVAPAASFGLGTANRVTLMYYHLQTDDLPDSGIPYDNPTYVKRTDGLPRVATAGSGEPINVAQDTYYGLADRDYQRARADMGTLRLEHDFSSHLHLRNTTRYAETEQNYVWTQPDDSNGNIYYGYVYRRPLGRISTYDAAINQTDFYGTGSTFGFHHSFSTGVEFSDERTKTDSFNITTASGAAVTTSKTCPASAIASADCGTVNDPNPYAVWSGTITPANNPVTIRTDTAAAYAFDTVALLRQLDFNAGLRFDNYQSRQKAAYATGSTMRSEYGRTDDLFNYQVGLVYKPRSNGSLYVSYATSATPAGNSIGQGKDDYSLGTVGDVLAPEKNRTLEVGTKWNVLRQRLLLTAAAFQIETKNAEITLADGSAALAGDKRVRGFEIGFDGSLTSRWSVTGGYSYLDARLLKAGGAGVAAGLQNGAEFPNTPQNSMSLWSTYQIVPRLVAGGGVYFMDRVYGNTNPAALKYVPSWWRFDAMATYEINRHADLQLNVLNIANRRYFSSAYAAHYATEAPGRSAFFTLTIRR